MTDDSIMPFGKHGGKKMSEVPDAYLLWLWDNFDDRSRRLHAELFAYIEDNLDAIKQNAKT